MLMTTTETKGNTMAIDIRKGDRVRKEYTNGVTNTVEAIEYVARWEGDDKNSWRGTYRVLSKAVPTAGLPTVAGVYIDPFGYAFRLSGNSGWWYGDVRRTVEYMVRRGKLTLMVPAPEVKRTQQWGLRTQGQPSSVVWGYWDDPAEPSGIAIEENLELMVREVAFDGVKSDWVVA